MQTDNGKHAVAVRVKEGIQGTDAVSPSDTPRIVDNYRPLGIRAVAAAFSIKRPERAIRSEEIGATSTTMPTGFWQRQDDDGF